MKYSHYFIAQILILFFPVEAYSTSYNWKEGVNGLITRCFETQDVNVHCEDLSEPEWRKNKIEELQIEASDPMGKKFSYSYEKGIAGNLCQEHYRKIQSLLRGAKEVCITGGIEWVYKDEKITNAKWRALETHKGRIVW